MANKKDNKEHKQHEHHHDECDCGCGCGHDCGCEDEIQEIISFQNVETGEEKAFEVIWEVFYKNARHIGMVELGSDDEQAMLYFAKEVNVSLQKSKNSKSNELETSTEYEMVDDEKDVEELFKMFQSDLDILDEMEEEEE